MPTRLAAGNWKMNGLGDSLAEIDALVTAHPAPNCDLLICPPATLLTRMAERTSGTALRVGGQDCHEASSGAHTGDISAEMLADAGASHVILGHSERRADHGETDALVASKAKAAAGAGLVPIICVGETLEEREAGDTLSVIRRQIAGLCNAGPRVPRNRLLARSLGLSATRARSRPDQIAGSTGHPLGAFGSMNCWPSPAADHADPLRRVG